ncbi:PucR family transcriptional regulator [Phaeacidiphilus oryzae]|uniref:PucR family transcriptional regulator n=1 Tax=Phaeacidiphilus oryzae TaxID=348818 RepID=UPI00056A3088|nr:helix-turn-helix domain-containing protein [Phaeacidiphilus oryzae]
MSDAVVAADWSAGEGATGPDGYARLLAEVAATGRRLTRGELDEHRARGEAAAGSGRSLRELVGRYLAATRAAWPENAPSADPVLAAMAMAVDAFADGYERAQRIAVRQEENARREFIDDLLYGRGDLGRLAQRAERFGLRLAHAYVVAVAAAADLAAYDAVHPVTRQVELALRGRFGTRSILLTTKDARLVCIAPADHTDVLDHFAALVRGADRTARVAVGRPHPGAGGVVHSYEEALNALDLADRLDLPSPLLHAADLLVYPVLTRDRDAMADLVRHALGPLERARGGAGPLLRTLSVYFDSGCVSAEAARRLALSVRALTYRLARVRDLTGADPADPAHRYTLQTAVIGARLLDWPARAL